MGTPMTLRTLAKATAIVLGIAALLAALLVALIAWSITDGLARKDAAHFDSVSAELARNRPAYDAAAARREALADIARKTRVAAEKHSQGA